MGCMNGMYEWDDKMMGSWNDGMIRWDGIIWDHMGWMGTLCVAPWDDGMMGVVNHQM